jgi:diketogulonate reductase-like aldo/keto reductase
MTSEPRSIELNNGIEMPSIGFGVFQIPVEQTAAAVETAIEIGYRLIDTAAVVGNEREAGEGIRRSGIDRDAMFITTKLWISDYGYDKALRAFDASLRRLGLDYLDLYLLHEPVPTDFDSTVAAYEALAELLAKGRVRAIGISNFGSQHLEALARQTDVVPAVNQVELHPYFTQPELREENARRGVVTQSWSPLGGVNMYSPHDPADVRYLLEDPTILELASTHEKTPAQVVLRWHIECGLSAIPKSVDPHRIKENIDIFDFALTPDEVGAIDALDTGIRGGPDPETIDTTRYPFKVEN